MNETYPVPLNGLRYFFWAAKLESFKLAAEKLNVSEAAVSQQIRNLESLLGIQLFRRKHQRIELTDKGHLFFPYIQTAFSNIHQGLNLVLDDPDPNRLTLTTMPSFASHWLISHLSSFNQRHPELSINMDTSVEQHNFENSHYDIAIRFGQGHYPGLKSELLMHDPVVMICHPKLLNGPDITREDIMRLPVIRGTFEGVESALFSFMKFFDFKDEQLSKTLLFKDGSLGMEAARSGQGISFQRMSLVVELVKSGELVYAKDYAFKDYSFYAVAPENHFKLKKVKSFLTWLKKEMRVTAKQIAPHLAKIDNLQ
ncbi:LysR substrate-binding domain-containing protein [Aliikangiella coralliicola]|uniref:LysR family transcriptional regulator n=1 Tax=Aliikangiella coralliicola TaxID=2592383 RepID=A0A545UAC3_9GAMM|nr:LysR substrate-binding domain-containing protein [Aliikangiella coralliicola]TQV86412.1 LysR family transcriptional regulator [Aliikangiella coralliicola]